ncbi:hypothetical protein HNR68_001004 [Saccharopolyspora hordei]|uniref:Uncharacterized protein n=1 Tax=Saccharopolyspora hordei TaxID=1838 RepID=A0A853AD34_9PSEU|nr:hypothetical protein [Saccharopolyspora hordei]
MPVTRTGEFFTSASPAAGSAFTVRGTVGRTAFARAATSRHLSPARVRTGGHLRRADREVPTTARSGQRPWLATAAAAFSAASGSR